MPYSPAHPFREMHRAFKPGGRLYLTTPNADSLSRVRLLSLGKNHEPSVDAFVDEDDPFPYKGMTSFKSNREARLWTVEELKALMPVWGFRVVDYYFYSSVVYDADFPSVCGGSQWLRSSGCIRCFAEFDCSVAAGCSSPLNDPSEK